MKKHTVVLGATSGIARALCHELAKRGDHLTLAARDSEELERTAADLRVRYEADVNTEPFDALDFDSHEEFVERCIARYANRVDSVVLCYGYMIDQATAHADLVEARRMLDSNFNSAVSLLSLFATQLTRRKSGMIVAISSVAGDRGRQSNYMYGAAKAGLSTYLQGLRNALFKHGVHVLTVKPGFVDTPMTFGLLDPKSPLVASPERVARDIRRAMESKKNVLYTPWYWHWIMTIIWAIPEPIFKRLKM